jgi:hypothetical protein
VEELLVLRSFLLPALFLFLPFSSSLLNLLHCVRAPTGLGKSRNGPTDTGFLIPAVAPFQVCGLVGFFLTSAYLYDYTKSTGQLLSLILTAVGGVGCAGAAKKNRNLLNVHFLGIAVAILLSFHFISQVGRETQVDCALAELYLRNHATEDNLRKQNSMDMFTNVFHRINEV